MRSANPRILISSGGVIEIRHQGAEFERKELHVCGECKSQGMSRHERVSQGIFPFSIQTRDHDRGVLWRRGSEIPRVLRSEGRAVMTIRRTYPIAALY
jgi:hypothetical protein